MAKIQVKIYINRYQYCASLRRKRFTEINIIIIKRDWHFVVTHLKSRLISTRCRRTVATICPRPGLQGKRAGATLSHAGRSGPGRARSANTRYPAGRPTAHAARRSPTRCMRQKSNVRQTSDVRQTDRQTNRRETAL